MSLQGTIVFTSGRTADFDIWTLDLATKKLNQLTHGNELHECPRFSPDGKKIAYICIDSDLISSLYIMDSDGQNKRKLSEKLHCQYPSWSPDGSSIIFTSNLERGDEIEICKIDLSSGEKEVLLQREGQETEPSMSPDGSKLIFAGIDPESTNPFPHRDTNIFEYDLNSKTERRLSTHPSRDSCPVYSPDGKQIAFVSYRNEISAEDYEQRMNDIKQGMNPSDRKSMDKAISALKQIEQDSDIYVMDINGENLKKLTKNEGLDMNPRWSPCGEYLTYSSAPKAQNDKERISIVNVNTGENVSLDYNREELMSEINANPERFLDNRIFMQLIPNFIEKPFMMMSIGSHFWGEERYPDWTSVVFS